MVPLQTQSAHRRSGTILPARRRDYLILLAIFLIGLALRLYRLDAQSVWYDEAFSVAYSARPLAELFKILIFDVVHPPLHYLILHEWFQVAGFGAMQARLVSAIFGALSIPLMFLLARRVTDSAASLVAAFLLAISQVGVYFSQEARPYAQAQFLSLLAALTFLSFLRKPDLRNSIFFAMASAALLYTHYYGAGTLLALGVYWLIFRRDYSPLVFRRLAAIVVLLAAAYVPWIVALRSGGQLNLARLTVQASPLGRPNPHPAITALSGCIASLNRFNNAKFESFEARTSLPQALLGIAVFTLPAAGALWFTWRKRPQGVVLGCLLGAMPVGLAVIAGAFGVMVVDRYYSFAAGGYYLAVALGWRVCLQNRAARYAWLAIVAIISAFALHANQVVTKPDYRAGLRPLAENYRPGDCVTGWPGPWNDRVPLAWEVYYRDRGVLRFVPFGSLSTASVGCEHLWVVWDRTAWMNQDPQSSQKFQVAIALLNGRYTVVERYNRPPIDLRLLVSQSAALQHR